MTLIVLEHYGRVVGAYAFRGPVSIVTGAAVAPTGVTGTTKLQEY